MPMHRLQRFDATPPSIAVADYSRTLRSVFRHAVGYALASALGASGCYASTDPPSDAMGGGGAGQSAPIVRIPGPVLPNTDGDGAAGQAAPVAQTPETPQPPETPQTPQPPQTARPAPVSLLCTNGVPQLFAGLTGEPFDAAEFRVQAASTEAPQIWFGQGLLCGTATDRAACESTIAVASDKANLPFVDSLPMFGMVARYVLTTLGDEVRKYQSREELLQFLGPIDSPEDALLLLFYDEYPVLCVPPSETGSFNGVDPASIQEVDDGYLVLFRSQTEQCSATESVRATLHVSTAGSVTEIARETMPAVVVCAGRRPEGLRSRHLGTSASALGEHFARMAHLEQASITAFEVLASELTRHGAPDELVARARSAAADEVRHTATMRELAQRFDVSPTTAEVVPVPPRSLEALAIDNAVEGCVRECFGAALGCYQAESATDPMIAAAMAEIAEDETQHAGLAFAIDAWARSRLDEPSRARVVAARARAVSTLRSELEQVSDPVTRAALGLPDAAAAHRVCTALEQSLWTT